MPMYTYVCRNCGENYEHVVPYDKRDAVRFKCEACGKRLKRAGVEAFKLGSPRYQCGAIMNNGAVIPGHFGKEAPMDPLKRKKK